MPISKTLITHLCILALAVVPTKFLWAQAADSVHTIGTIYIVGNEKTKPYIVLRELTFKSGDILTQAQLQKSITKATSQIFNLKLFTSVQIQHTPPDSLGKTHIYIYLKERWYLFVLPIVEIADRNFNEWFRTRRIDRLNYGVRLTLFNVRGRNETLRLNLQSGFTNKASIDYSFPYINKALTIGADINFTYSDNKEVWHKVENNKLKFFRDTEGILFRRYKASATINYRKNIYTTQALTAEFNHLQIADTVVSKEVNPNYFLNAATFQKSLYLSYTYTYDTRDFRGYALQGYYLLLDAGNYIFANNAPPIAVAILNTSIHKKIAKKYFANISVSGKYSSQAKQPYNLYKAFGYKYFVRGFEYNVVDGQHFALAKATLLYNILKQKNISLNTNKLKKFRNIPFAAYLKIFYDAGYVRNPMATPDNTFANSYLAGTGVGLDIISYYDRVLKLEYSVNNKGQSGLFLHFNTLF